MTVLDGLEQLVDPSQVRMLGVLREWASRERAGAAIADVAREAVPVAKSEGLYRMGASPELAEVRAEDVAAALNRLRGLKLAFADGR